MRKALKNFLQLESASGIILFAAAVLAMIWANSPLAHLQQIIIHQSLFFINEGLMAIFFLLVGLELKRGFLEGQLSTRSQIALPAFAALGGMVMPALIYLAVTAGDPVAMKGWATPAATDIAFALGVLTLFGNRIPDGLKLFLLALAIFDDVGAIFIIGAFYSHDVSLSFLLLSVLLTGCLYLMNKRGVSLLTPFILIGVLLWAALLFSGIHPTLSGVILAMMIPGTSRDGVSLLHRVEERLHPWVAFLIMPLFALGNAGFSLEGMSFNPLNQKIALGIILGLFLGKQIGVFGTVWLLIKMKMAKLPEKASWQMFYGVALLCGIGFTMSLFLGTLSFQPHLMYLNEVRFGVMAGSMLSGLFGAIMLLLA